MTTAGSVDRKGKAPPRSLFGGWPALLVGTIFVTAMLALYPLAQGFDYQAAGDQARA